MILLASTAGYHKKILVTASRCDIMIIIHVYIFNETCKTAPWDSVTLFLGLTRSYHYEIIFGLTAVSSLENQSVPHIWKMLSKTYIQAIKIHRNIRVFTMKQYVPQRSFTRNASYRTGPYRTNFLIYTFYSFWNSCMRRKPVISANLQPMKVIESTNKGSFNSILSFIEYFK